MDPDPNGMADYQLLGDGFGYHSYGSQSTPSGSGQNQQPGAPGAGQPTGPSNSMMNPMPGQAYHVPGPRYPPPDPSKGMLHGQYAPFSPAGQPPQMSGIGGPYPPDPRSFPGMTDYSRPPLGPPGHLQTSQSPASNSSPYSSRLMPGQFGEQRAPPGIAAPRASAPMHAMGGHQSYAGYPATSAPPGYGHPGSDVWAQSQVQHLSQRPPYPYSGAAVRSQTQVPGFPDQYNSSMHQLQSRPYFAPPASQGPGSHHSDGYPQSGFSASSSSGPSSRSSSSSRSQQQQQQPPQSQYPFPPASSASSRYPAQYAPYGQSQQPFPEAARLSPYGLPPGVGPNSPGYRQPYPAPAPLSSQMSPRRPTPTPPAGSPHQPPTSRTPDRVVSATTVSVSQSQPSYASAGSNQLTSSSVVSPPSSSSSSAPPSNSLAQLEQLVVSGSGLPLSAAPGPKNTSASTGSGSFYSPLPTGAPAQNVYSHFPSPSPSPGQHSSQPQQQQNYYYQPPPGSSWPASQSGQLPPAGSSSSLPGSSPGSSAGFSSSMRSPQQPPASSSSSSGVAKSPLNSQFSAYDNSQFSSPASDTFPGAPASKSGDLTSLSSMQKFDTTSSFGSPVTPSQSQQKTSDQDSDPGKEERKETEPFAESRTQSSPGSSFYGSLRSSSVDTSSASSSVPPEQSLSHKKNDSINQQSSSQGPAAPGSSPGEMSYLTRPYAQHQSDPGSQQPQYMNQQMYSQSQQPYPQQMSQFGSSYSDPSLSFDMSSGMNDQPAITQMSSYGSHPDQRMYDQSYGQGHGQGMDSGMLGPGPSSEYTGEMGDMGMGYQPSPYDEPFSSEPPTKKKGKGRPKKDPAEPKKEKKPRQPRVPKAPRGRGRGGRANMGDRMPAPQPHEYGDSGGGYGMPGMPPDAPDMFGPPPPHHHMHPGPHSLPPHMSSAPPQDPFRGPPQMIAPPLPAAAPGMHHPAPGMCLPEAAPLPPHMSANSFDGVGQPPVPVPVPSAVPSLPPAPSSEPPPPVETLLDSSQPPPTTSAKSPALPAAGVADAADPNRSDSQANDSADGEKEPAAEDPDPPDTVVQEDLFSQSTSTSNDNSAFVLPSSEDSSSLLPPIPQPDSPLFPAEPHSSPPPGSPSAVPAQDTPLPEVPAADEEPAPLPADPTTKRKGKKRKSKLEKAVGGQEPAEPAKKAKRSGGGKKKKKKVEEEETAVAETTITADLATATTDTTIDTEASSIADLTDSTAAGAFDDATQEGDAGVADSGAGDGTPKGKKGKGKGTPKGAKKPKLKEGKSSAKKKLPKIALAKFKGRKKKRLGSSDHNSDIEKTPPPSPDETESGIQKRRSGRVTKRTKYLDEVDLDLSADDSKKDDDKKEVATVVVDDTMVVEKIMCTRMGTRELEPENEEEEARFKQGKPPTVEVEEFYVKYKNLSYLHCDWRTEEELEKGDKRINQKIKRYKMKKDSNTSYDFLDDEPFNPDYCEVDRILDVNIVTEEIPIPDPSPPVAQESATTQPSVETTDKVEECRATADSDEPVKHPDDEVIEKGDSAVVSDHTTTDDVKPAEPAVATGNPGKLLPDAEKSDTVVKATESESAEVREPEPVEEVKPKKTRTRTMRHYLVKWQALPYEESTWELEDDLDPEKVKQFWRFREMPPKDVMKHKKRPKPHEWKKLDESPVYKSGNTLREYQLEGLNWLTFCWYNSRNCILADEMGLGKTIQSLTFINEMVKFGMHSPYLIIAPLSTIGNWQREFETWTDLNVITYHGSSASRNMITEYEMYFKNEKGEKVEGVYKFQVMITTFEVVLTDCLELREIVWRACVIDEAHRLKNRNCKLLEGLRLLQMEHRVLLTGTPLQNNVEELFSLLNFLEPVQFSSPESFMLDFGDLKTEEQVEKLQAILKPMMLRRLKEDVEKSLAPKEETIVEVELTNIQKKYYRAILERNFQFLSKGGTYANMPNLMNTMMELRKCCIHPFLINSAEEQISADYKQQYTNEPDGQLKCMVQASGKLVLIDKLLPRLRADGHRVLIFSQMVRCLDILEDYVIQKKYPYERIDGRVRGNMRQAAIDRFSKPGSDRFVFLLCTRAGGLGINLTAADTVIIFDSDWNPQNDLQAQARCHRIGQSKMVKVYRLICRNTYEREMFDKASLKLGLDKAVLQSMNTGQKAGSGGADANAPLSKKEVEELLRKGAYGAVMDDDNAGDKFCEEDIDQILTRRTQVITIDSGEKGSTFSRASFATSDNADIELDDPNFWEKWAKKANIDSEEFVSKNELIVQEPRRRTQTKRFGQDDGVMEMSEADSSDDDEENVSGRTRGGRGRPVRGKKGKRGRGNGYERERDEDYLEDFGPGNWARAECYKVEKALLTYGWGRWEEFVAMGNFRRRLTTQDVEDIARVLLLYSLRNYKGDEKIKSFIFDLITPVDQADKSGGKSPGSCSPTGRGRKNRKSSRKTVAEELTASDWASSDAYNPEVLLVDEQYRKHLSKQMNKLLLRVKLLYYLAHEIIGDLRDDVLRGVTAREIPIPQPIADGDPPSAWWDEECDKSLLIGVFKHGYDRYNLMRQDTSLCFFHRCGPPDGAALLAEIQDDDMGRLEEDEEPETPATPATQDSVKEEVADGETSGRLAFPSRADMNQRLRRIVTAYQKHSKRQEVRMAQQARHQQRLEKLERFEAAIKERELKKRETAQKKWSRREEADFYRVVSSYGVEFDRQSQQFDWNKFRTFSRLEKKVDETLTEYFKAFYGMCKRVTGRRLTDEEENLQISVDPISEERASRCLARIDLLSKIREEILPSPDLQDKLQICQPSIDLPDWWVCGKHDKDLLIGAARYGLNRLDQSVMHDPDLSFREILRKAEAEAKRQEEAAFLIKEGDKTPEMLNGTTGTDEIEEKPQIPNGASGESDETCGEAKGEKKEGQDLISSDPDVKLEHPEEASTTDEIAVGEDKPDGGRKTEIPPEQSRTVDEKEKVATEEDIPETGCGEKIETGKNGIPVKQTDEELVNGQTDEAAIQPAKLVSPEVEENTPVLANGDLNGHGNGSPNASSETETSPTEKVVETSDKAADEEPVNEVKSSDDGPDSECDRKESEKIELKPVCDPVIDDKLTVKNAEDGDREEEGAVSSTSFKEKIENADDDRKPENLTLESLIDNDVKPQSSTPTGTLAAIPLPAKAVRWPKDRVLQMRLEQIVYCFEKNEWPSMRHTFFSTLATPSQSTPSIATADSSPRAVSPGSLSSVSREPTPHPTPEQTPRRELSPLPDYLFDSAGDSARRRKRRRRRYDPETEKRAKLRNLLTQNPDQSPQQHQFQHQPPPQPHAALPAKNKSSMSAAQSAQSLLNHASSFLPPNFFSSLPFVNSLRSDLRNDFLSDEKTASLLLGSLSRPQSQTIASMTSSSKHGHGSSHTQSSPSPGSGPPPAHQSSSKRNAPAESLDLRFRTNPMLVPPPAPAHKPSPKLPPLSKNRATPSTVPSVLDLSSGPSLPKRPSRTTHPSQPAPSPPPPQPSGGRSAKRIGSRLDAIALNLQAKKMMEEKTDPKESNFLNEITTRKSEKRKQESSHMDHLQHQLQKKSSTPPAAHSGSSSSKSLSSMSDLLGKSLGSGSLGFGNLFDVKAGQSKSSEASAILEQANAMKQNFNRWLESHPEFVQANPDLAAAAAAAMAFSPLSSSMPANTELLELPEGRRRGRRPRAETVSQAPADPPAPPLNLNFDETVPVVHRQTGKRVSGHKAPLLRNLTEWLEKNPGYEIDTKCSPLTSEKFSNFKVPVSTPQQSSAAGIRTRTSDRGSSRSSSSESHAPTASSGSGGGSNSRRTTAASLLANAHAHGNHLNSTPTSGSSFGFPSSSLTSSLTGFNPNLLSGFPNNMKMFLDSMAAVSSSPSSSSSTKTSSSATSGASTSTTSSSSSSQNALSSFFPFAGLAGIAGLQNPLLGFSGLNFPGYPGLGSFGDEAPGMQKVSESKSSTKSATSKSASEKKAEKAKHSSNSAAQMFGSANSSLGSSAMPFLYPNPNFLYSGLGLGGFSGLSGSSPFASLAQSGLMNGLGGMSGSSSSMSSSPKSGSRGKSSPRTTTGAPSGLSLSTASSLLSAQGIHPSSAAAAAAMGDSDDESLKSLMGHEDDDEDLNGDLDDVPSKDDSDSDYDTRPKRKTSNKSKTDLNKSRKSGASAKAPKN